MDSALLFTPEEIYPGGVGAPEDEHAPRDEKDLRVGDPVQYV